MSYLSEIIIVLWMLPVVMFIVIPLFLSVLIILKRLLPGASEARGGEQRQVGERGYLPT